MQGQNIKNNDITVWIGFSLVLRHDYQLVRQSSGSPGSKVQGSQVEAFQVSLRHSMVKEDRPASGRIFAQRSALIF